MCACQSACLRVVLHPYSLRPGGCILDTSGAHNRERALLFSDGLPRRPWMRHQIMAPGRYTGYAAKTLPYVREAIEAGRWEEARDGVSVISGALDRYSTIVDQVSSALADK